MYGYNSTSARGTNRFDGTGSTCGSKEKDGAGHRRTDLLAVVLADGAACSREEAEMWKRSQVEKLTGLTRDMIQPLCYQNKKNGGYGFWVPAVHRPGYSRFDEGDLLMFYLVGQLKRAGFTLEEVEPVVLDIFDDGGTSITAFRAKTQSIHAKRAKLDSQLAMLECLEESISGSHSDRVYSVMEQSMRRSMTRATDGVRLELGASRELEEAVLARLLCAVELLVSTLKGEADQGSLTRISAIRQLVGQSDGAPDNEAKCAFCEIVAEIAKGAEDVGGEILPAELVLRSLDRFLAEAENGVPVELVFGEGSFAFLAATARECVVDLES